jgi:hypothetical protein
MHYPDLANTTSALIRTDLTVAGFAITPETETYLTALETRDRCWKGVFAATGAWLSTANAQEQAVAWMSIVNMCNHDGRPLAAMSRLFHFKNDQAALKTLWQALPAGTLPELQVCLAANPLLLALFKIQNSGVTGLPSELVTPAVALSVWERVQRKLAKLSRFENPHST